MCTRNYTRGDGRADCLTISPPHAPLLPDHNFSLHSQFPYDMISGQCSYPSRGGKMISQEDFYKIIRQGDYSTPDENRPAKPVKRGFRSWYRYYVNGLLAQIFLGLKYLRRKCFRFDTFGEMSFNMLRASESTGATVTFEGFSKLKSLNGSPFVAVCNHISLIETMVLPVSLFAFSNTTVVAKKSLTKYPGFGTVLYAVRAIMVERQNPRQDLAEVLKQGTELLKDGVSILLFPQGKRSPEFNPRKFNSLGAKLAARAGVPLVPVACKTDMAVNVKGPFKDLGPIDPSKTVKFAMGPVLDSSLSQRDLQKSCTDFISGKLREWNMPVADELQTAETTEEN